MDELKYQIALTCLPGVGNVNAKALVGYCGSVEAVFREKKSSLEKIPGIGPRTAAHIVKHRSLKQAEKEVQFIRRSHIKPLFFLSENYPRRLKHCADGPVMLYYRGNADLNAVKTVAVVGTRNATEYGKRICERLIGGLAGLNTLIVSGLAYGIDITAHKASLENGLMTVGVMGTGLDRVYPGTHLATARKMEDQGGLLSEFVSGTDPDRENFPKRNRIIAGMSDAVIVVEAAESGGALITAEIANSYNRDVFAVPGKADDEWSKGCNFLIKTNRAMLIESADDVRYIMNWDEPKQKPRGGVQKSLFVDLKEEEKKLVDILQENSELDIDTLCALAAMPVSKVAATLLELEFNGLVKALPGKRYRLN